METVQSPVTWRNDILPTDKSAIVNAIREFVIEQPYMDVSDFGDLSQGAYEEYRDARREVEQDKQNALEQLSIFEQLPYDTGVLFDALRWTRDGRMSITVTNDKVTVEYCAGGFYPMIYRHAMYQVLETYNAVMMSRE